MESKIKIQQSHIQHSQIQQSQIPIMNNYETCIEESCPIESKSLRHSIVNYKNECEILYDKDNLDYCSSEIDLKSMLKSIDMQSKDDNTESANDNVEMSWNIIESYFKGHHLERLVRHQIESYNNFVSYQITKTI